MNVKYDKEVDVLYIGFSEEKIKESDEEKPGIILDYDKQGSIVGIEILNASKRMGNPAKVEYEVNLTESRLTTADGVVLLTMTNKN